MPIRINLLAERHALLDEQRRDPVKLGILAALGVILLVVAWGTYYRVRLIQAKSSSSAVDGKIKALEASFREAQTNEARLADVRRRIEALDRLALSRTLWGNALNALQYTIVDGVKLREFRVDQSFSIVEAVKPKTNANKTVTPGRPAGSKEKLVLRIDGRDATQGNPGGQIDRFKERLNAQAFFRTNLGEIKLTARSPVISESEGGGETFVIFTLEAADERELKP